MSCHDAVIVYCGVAVPSLFHVESIRRTEIFHAAFPTKLRIKEKASTGHGYVPIIVVMI